MTNIIAINLLDNLIGMIDDNHGNNYDNALKMGKKALESLESIKRDIEIINTASNYRRHDSNFWEGFYMVTDIINKYYPDEVET